MVNNKDLKDKTVDRDFKITENQRKVQEGKEKETPKKDK